MILQFLLAATVSILAILASACASINSTPATAAPTQDPDNKAAVNSVLTSNAFSEGSNIPAKFTCSGEGVSPQLKWSGVPANTKSFALIMDDPDAPGGTFTHWVAFDIPATQTEIAEGARSVGKDGKNGRGQTGYTGPCPPSGTHRYFFTVYALDLTTLDLNNAASRTDVETAMKLHILAVTQLMGRYSK
jgi:Raf kinase inhibitor-like YbhB/YbcL family protein